MRNDEHSRRVAALLLLGDRSEPFPFADELQVSVRTPLTHQEVTAQIVGSLLDDAAERMTALVERIADPPRPRLHGVRVSDQEALLNANQHEIQRDFKW